jgi:hypothetical protein
MFAMLIVSWVLFERNMPRVCFETEDELRNARVWNANTNNYGPLNPDTSTLDDVYRDGPTPARLVVRGRRYRDAVKHEKTGMRGFYLALLVFISCLFAINVAANVSNKLHNAVQFCTASTNSTATNCVCNFNNNSTQCPPCDCNCNITQPCPPCTCNCGSEVSSLANDSNWIRDEL